MKLPSVSAPRSALPAALASRPSGSARRAGFTMIEIAIALGVIAFALVAIIGILPTGLQVQRDNRAETIINQDAVVWMEAIRGGAKGMDDLVASVDRIDIHYNFNSATLPETVVTHTGFKTGWEIIGLLSTPARTNAEVYASVWAFSGSAAEKEPNAADRAIAFKYRLRVNIEPGPNNAVSFFDNTVPRPAGDPALYPLTTLYDLRLTLGFPLVREDPAKPLRDQAPPRSQTVRSAVSRSVMLEVYNGLSYTFFTP